MSVAAISIGPAAASGAVATPKAGKAKAFDAVMVGVGQPPRNADAPSNDDADARVAAKDDQDDTDRKDTRDDRARDAGEDPAALLALAGSVAALTRNDAAPAVAGKAVADGKAATPPVATAALTLLATPAEAAAQPAQPTPAEAAPDAAAVSATLPAATQQVQPPAAKSAKPMQKSMIGAATTSTADILAARAAKVAPVDAAHGGDKDAADTDSDDGDVTLAPDSTLAAVATPVTPSISLAADASPAAGQTLAAGSADRQLDLAKGDAWLDGLARDIASSADSSGTLRFQLSPQALGNLHVELTRGDDGTAVRMTTATVDAQAILADARPRLIESARAHGVHISDATVDLGGAGTATTGGQHRDPAGDGGSSNPSRTAANLAGGGDTNGQAQSRPQNEPDLYHGARRQGMIASAPAGGARQDLDAGYA